MDAAHKKDGPPPATVKWHFAVCFPSLTSLFCFSQTPSISHQDFHTNSTPLCHHSRMADDNAESVSAESSTAEGKNEISGSSEPSTANSNNATAISSESSTEENKALAISSESSAAEDNALVVPTQSLTEVVHKRKASGELALQQASKKQKFGPFAPYSPG